MDKTIEIILVAVVAIVTASILLFLMQGEADSFGDFLDSQSSDAKCDLWKTQYKNQVCSEDSTGAPPPSSVFPDKNLGQCSIDSTWSCS